MTAEQRMEELVETTRSNTFRAVVEWIKDSREAWERHLASQDHKLEEIHAEVRRTNSRVTALEKRDELLDALGESKKLWESERTDQDKEVFKAKAEREVRKSDRFWKAAQLFGVFIGGGISAEIAHLLGG